MNPLSTSGNPKQGASSRESSTQLPSIRSLAMFDYNGKTTGTSPTQPATKSTTATPHDRTTNAWLSVVLVDHNIASRVSTQDRFVLSRDRYAGSSNDTGVRIPALNPVTPPPEARNDEGNIKTGDAPVASRHEQDSSNESRQIETESENGIFRYEILTNGVEQALPDCFDPLGNRFPKKEHPRRSKATPRSQEAMSAWLPYIEAMGLRRNEFPAIRIEDVQDQNSNAGDEKQAPSWAFLIYVLIAVSPRGCLSLNEIYNLALAWCAREDRTANYATCRHVLTTSPEFRNVHKIIDGKKVGSGGSWRLARVDDGAKVVGKRVGTKIVEKTLGTNGAAPEVKGNARRARKEDAEDKKGSSDKSSSARDSGNARNRLPTPGVRPAPVGIQTSSRAPIASTTQTYPKFTPINAPKSAQATDRLTSGRKRKSAAKFREPQDIQDHGSAPAPKRARRHDRISQPRDARTPSSTFAGRSAQAPNTPPESEDHEYLYSASPPPPRRHPNISGPRTAAALAATVKRWNRARSGVREDLPTVEELAQAGFVWTEAPRRTCAYLNWLHKAQREFLERQAQETEDRLRREQDLRLANGRWAEICQRGENFYTCQICEANVDTRSEIEDYKKQILLQTKKSRNYELHRHLSGQFLLDSEVSTSWRDATIVDKFDRHLLHVQPNGLRRNFKLQAIEDFSRSNTWGERFPESHQRKESHEREESHEMEESHEREESREMEESHEWKEFQEMRAGNIACECDRYDCEECETAWEQRKAAARVLQKDWHTSFPQRKEGTSTIH